MAGRPDLPQLYDEAEPETQKRILQSLIERVEVPGPDRLWIYPSDEAQAPGLAAAFAGEFRTKVRQTGRGERDRPSDNYILLDFASRSLVERVETA